MSVNIKPLEDRVLVKQVEAEQTTASGLVIPDTAKEKPQEGEVIAVGPGRFNEDGDERIPLDVKVGDKVIYSKFGGTEVKYSGEEYLVLAARDLLAVVDLEAVRAAGFDPITLVTVPNTATFAAVEPAPAGEVAAGDAVLTARR